MLELFEGDEEAKDGDDSGGKTIALLLKQSCRWDLLPRGSNGKGAASRDSTAAGGGGGTLLPSSTPNLVSLPPVSQFDTFLPFSPALGSSFLRTSTVA